MRILVAFALVASLTASFDKARAADDFEVLPDVYGACIALFKSSDGNSRNDCMSNASIYNKSNGSIYFCEAHLVVSVEGLQLESRVSYKKISCQFLEKPAHPDGSAYSIGSKDEYLPRRLPPAQGAGIVPSRFYWITRRDKLAPEVCFNFSEFRGFAGCFEAKLQQETKMQPETKGPPATK